LHFFVVFRASQYVHTQVMDLSNFYLACAWALVFFLLMVIPGYLSYRFIEAPFLKLRKRYIVSASAVPGTTLPLAPTPSAASASPRAGQP
jgi:peptidoglycan/LPS O-acetylase OafA/YrhL